MNASQKRLIFFLGCLDHGDCGRFPTSGEHVFHSFFAPGRAPALWPGRASAHRESPHSNQSTLVARPRGEVSAVGCPRSQEPERLGALWKQKQFSWDDSSDTGGELLSQF